MKKLALVLIIPVLLLLPHYGAVTTSDSAYAGGVVEKTLEVDGSTIAVKVIGDIKVDVVAVKPYIKAKKGETKGRLHLDVVVKNVGTTPAAYSIFGQGQTESGGWLGGQVKFPKKTKLEPGEEKKANVRTRWQGTAPPKMIRVEVFPTL